MSLKMENIEELLERQKSPCSALVTVSMKRIIGIKLVYDKVLSSN